MTHTHKLLGPSALLAALVIGACATDPTAAPSDAKESAACDRTKLSIRYESSPTPMIRERLEQSVSVTNELLAGSAFHAQCNASKMSRTNGRSIGSVCKDLICSGPTEISIGFYEKRGTSAIAYEQDGVLFLNVAKESAGGPGNVMHEFAHTKGYTHFTNFRFLGKRSVPYVVGDLIDLLAGERDAAQPHAAPDVSAAASLRQSRG